MYDVFFFGLGKLTFIAALSFGKKSIVDYFFN